jgi:hypothetical protein
MGPEVRVAECGLGCDGLVVTAVRQRSELVWAGMDRALQIRIEVTHGCSMEKSEIMCTGSCGATGAPEFDFHITKLRTIQ